MPSTIPISSGRGAGAGVGGLGLAGAFAEGFAGAGGWAGAPWSAAAPTSMAMATTDDRRMLGGFTGTESLKTGSDRVHAKRRSTAKKSPWRAVLAKCGGQKHREAAASYQGPYTVDVNPNATRYAEAGQDVVHTR